jgi:phosphoadenosine phosphosulfate reductase
VKDVSIAIKLLRRHRNADLRLAFSGGKDSIACKRLLEMAIGSKGYSSYYSCTTMDPPELVKFIKKEHPDVPWIKPKIPMMTAVATLPKSPPTRLARWCCSIYKETTDKHLHGLTILGVRGEESPRRAKTFSWLTEMSARTMALLPILDWSEEDVWEFIDREKIPYCSLYDEEGISRLGCVGCPLAGRRRQDWEFQRWPGFGRNWERAVKANWAKWHGVPRQRDGEPRYQSKFKDAEALWAWWRRDPGSVPIPCACGSTDVFWEYNGTGIAAERVCRKCGKLQEE